MTLLTRELFQVLFTKEGNKAKERSECLHLNVLCVRPNCKIVPAMADHVEKKVRRCPLRIAYLYSNSQMLMKTKKYRTDSTSHFDKGSFFFDWGKSPRMECEPKSFAYIWLPFDLLFIKNCGLWLNLKIFYL